MGINDSNVTIIKPTPRPLPDDPLISSPPKPLPTLREELRALLHWLKVWRWAS